MNRIRKRKDQKEATNAAAGRRPKLPRAFLDILNGSFLTRERLLRNMPFLLYVAFLGLLYIGYGYAAERTVRDIHRTESELKEQRSAYITVRSRLDQAEQQSRVAEGIANMGLRESRVPPRRIQVDRDEMEHTRR